MNLLTLLTLVLLPLYHCDLVQNRVSVAGPNGQVNLASASSADYAELMDLVVGTASGDMGELIASASSFNANQTDPSKLIGIGSGGNTEPVTSNVKPLNLPPSGAVAISSTGRTQNYALPFAPPVRAAASMDTNSVPQQRISPARTTKMANVGPNGLKISPFTLKPQGERGGPPNVPPSNRVTVSSAAVEPTYFASVQAPASNSVYNTFFSYAEPAGPNSGIVSADGMASCEIPNSKYDDWVAYLPPKIASDSPSWVGCLESYCVKAVFGNNGVVLKYNGQGKGPNYTIQMSEKAYAALTVGTAPTPIIPVVWQIVACGIFPYGPSDDLLIDFRQSSSVINKIINENGKDSSLLPLVPASEFGFQ